MHADSAERLRIRDILVLATVACAQLLVILDTTIVNIAVPFAAGDLAMGDDGRQWIITAYALAFGAILLIGGRIADYWGRKRTFLLGVALFAAASIWGGAATAGGELLIARALQGGSAALMAPAALSILTTTFPGGRPRALAFGIIGGIMSSGAAVGLILGGVLTEFAGWRWCLFINVPFALVAAIAGALVLRESKTDGVAHYDIWGALTVAIGVSAVVFGLTRAEAGLIEGGALPLIAVGVLFLGAFVLIERRSAGPLLPLRVIIDRTRGGAFAAQFLAGAAMIGVTLYVTLYLQQVLGFGPLVSGLASLPLAAAVAAAMPLFISLIPRIGLKAVLVAGAAVAAIGVALLALLAGVTSYVGGVLPGMVVMGAGMAGVFAAAQNLALLGVDPADAGAGSAASNAMNQIGGAVGLAVLTNVFVAAGTSEGGAPTAGYSAAYLAAAGALAIAVVVAGLVIRTPVRAEVAPSVAALH